MNNLEQAQQLLKLIVDNNISPINVERDVDWSDYHRLTLSRYVVRDNITYTFDFKQLYNLKEKETNTMFDLHQTADGRSLLICQMDDSHLMNTISMYCRNIKNARLVIEQGNVKLPTVAKVLTGNKFDRERQVANAESTIRSSHNKLQPYVMEASLRGLNISELLQDAYGRKTDAGVDKLEQLPTDTF